MGEGNALAERKRVLRRDTALAAAAAYCALFPGEGGAGVSATWELIFVCGWAPSESQPKPMRRGSAELSLGDLEKLVGAEAKDDVK
jgi:NADH dehydrogenase [ubiquinone] 1 alpha subcomplex assembly factor 5